MYMSTDAEITNEPQKVYFPEQLESELKFLDILYKCIMEMDVSADDLALLA